MRLVFLGTPEFAIPSLSLLYEMHEIGLVITRPSRPVGRKRTLTPPPVFDESVRLGLECIQPSDVNSPDVVDRIRSIEPVALVAVAYGRIVGNDLLRVAPHGVFNIHPSLLPRHRGAAPVQGAILAGDSETGVTVMRMDAGLDTGPILSQRSMSIGSKESAEGLESRLAVAGAELLVEALEQLERGPLVPRPQDESLATMTRPLRRSDGKIDWQKTAEEIYRLWRGLHPWPGIHTIVGGETLKVLRCSISDDDCTGPPGRACVSQGRLIVATGGGCVEIPLIQPEGGKAMSGGEFAIGHGAAMDADWGT